MATYIDADKKVHIQVYNDEHEEYIVLEQTIAECLDSYTDEGCPEPADVQEVKHGKWDALLSFPPRYCCSECLTITDFAYTYCPWCGAKMDGKGE